MGSKILNSSSESLAMGMGMGSRMLNLSREDLSRPHSPRLAFTKWDAYSQTLLDKGVISKFGIFGLKKFRVWSATPGFQMQQNGLKAIASGFTDDLHLRNNGMRINGTIFTLTRMSWNHVMMLGRCSATGSGCVVYKCGTCLLIAVHDEGQQTSLCVNSVEKLGDYLVEQGF